MNRHLKYPGWRSELLDHLENITSPRVRFEWTTHPYAARSLRHLKFVSNFVFDTIAIRDDPANLVGLVFYDPAELAAVQRFSEALGETVDRNEETDVAVLTDPEWPRVVSAAEDALRILKGGERH